MALWSNRTVFALFCLPLVLLPGAARASDTPTGSEAATAIPASSAALPAKPVEASADKFKSFDALNLKGWDIPYPSTQDTILGDKGGFRTSLADAGFGFSGYIASGFQYDLLQNDRGYRGRQLYNGQDFTRTSTSVTLTGTS